MNKDILQGKWEQIKGTIIKKFGELTDDELKEIQGDTTKLKGILQEKYGHSKEDAEKMYGEVFGEYEFEKNYDVNADKRSEEELLREEADKIQERPLYKEIADAKAYISEDNKISN